ncbi:MAG TPA: peroxiredoxin family protein [Candidatus Kapabacteria bacterium]|nr:peroxiredoxin family protein [Candidatus Kapabacteria bacterium]
MQQVSQIRVSPSLWAIFGLCIAIVSNPAQEPSETGQRPGHSAHGEAFDEGPRQKAELMQGMPDLQFPVSTRSPDAQKFFNQGVGQLHGFWYFEAERSFRQVLKLDTNCVMAYWGLTMANVNNEKRAKEFIEAGVKRTNGIPRREFLYVDSLAKFYLKEQKNETEKHRDYIRSLEQIVVEFPDDIEAKAFLVFKIWENQGRQKIPSHLAVDALAKEVLAAKPMHPIHHARIHLWNNEKDERALDSAAKCGPGSPGIAHMWHMPGHTYSALNRYNDAAWQQEASARVDHAYMMENRVLPDQIHNYAHNSDWFAKNLSYLGRVREAIDLAKNLVELPRHPKFNRYDVAPKSREIALEEIASSSKATKAQEEKKTESTGSDSYSKRDNSASYGRARLLELLVQWELWDEIIELSSTLYLEPTSMPHEQAKRARALGLAYFEKGDTRRGKAQMAELSRALRAQKDLRHESADDAEEKAKEEKKADGDVAKAMTDAINTHSGKIKNIEELLSELRVYNSITANELDAAKTQMADLKSVPKERMAQLWSRLGNKEKAEELAREAYKDSTNQVLPLANYIEMMARSGKETEASEAFKVLTRVGAQADLDLPILKRIQAVAQKVALAADWRLKPEKASDLGQRPALDTLGPFRWNPTPAVDWSLKRSDGRDLGLRTYQGRPVIMIFYLGYGCMRCIEQLNSFAPRVKDFDSAGISLVAVSTDSVEGLRKTLAKSTTANGFPFPIVSDESLATFKAYRAYDDFEEMPLHGTYLIDGNGMVRWQDVSFEPFTDVDFLLAESQRLLKLPVNGVVAAVKVPERRAPLSPRAASQTNR